MADASMMEAMELFVARRVRAQELVIVPPRTPPALIQDQDTRFVFRRPRWFEMPAWGWIELNLYDKAGNCQSHRFTELGIVAPVE